MHGTARQASPGHGIEGERLAYKVHNAARLLDLSERKVWELVKSGDLESVKVGGSRLITRDALIAYLKAQAEATA
jgi:excisionase family DNA binding protein